MSVVVALLVGVSCLVIPVLVVVVLVVSLRNAQRRQAERQADVAGWAQRHEWEYRPTDSAMVTRFAGPPFGTGSDRRAVNVVLGRDRGRAFTAFDYSYTTTSTTHDSHGSHSHTVTHGYGVVALHLGVRAPALTVGPSSTMKRFWDSFVHTDIEIGDPEFDRDFLVRSDSPEFARDVLSPEVIATTRLAPGFAWRLSGDSLLVVRPGQQAPAEIEAKLAFMSDVLDRIPQHVWARLGGTSPEGA